MPSLPAKIGKYDVKRLLATGAMGDVYLAATVDERTRVPVHHAIKVLNPKSAKRLAWVTRLRTDAKDDCLLDFREIDYDADREYFVSDYLEVKPVSRAILKKERSSEILDLFARVAAGLDKGHRKNYVHGNVKTSNFLIRRGKDENNRESVHPILSDYGITYVPGPDLFGGDRLRSVAAYMSPERIDSLVAGDAKNEGVTPASDVYSLGAVLAEALSGSAPFAEAGDLEALKKAKREKRYLLLHVNHPVRHVDIRRLNDVLKRCLAPDPAGRYASAGEFASAISACRLQPAGA